MNLPSYVFSCVLFTSLVSLGALAVNRLLRRFATARHGMLLSALVLILVSPAWIALLRTPQVASRNPLSRLLVTERDTKTDSEPNIPLPSLSATAAEAEALDSMKRRTELMPIDEVSWEENGTT